MTENASFIEAAINANRDNFIMKASSWAHADPLFSVKELKGATAVFSGSSTDTFNVLALTRDTDRQTFKIIEEARNEIFKENRFAVWSWEDGQLQSLPVDNTAIEEHVIMACEIDALAKIPDGRKPLTVTPVSEPQHIIDASTVLASTFEASEEGFMIQSVFSGQDDTGLEKLALKYLLSYEEGKAVSTGSYISNGTIAGIYDIAVLPSWQKKGQGSRMFDAVLAACIKSGATNFTLQATSQGASIYEKAGFQPLGACWSLDIS